MEDTQTSSAPYELRLPDAPALNPKSLTGFHPLEDFMAALDVWARRTIAPLMDILYDPAGIFNLEDSDLLVVEAKLNHAFELVRTQLADTVWAKHLDPTPVIKWYEDRKCESLCTLTASVNALFLGMVQGVITALPPDKYQPNTIRLDDARLRLYWINAALDKAAFLEGNLFHKTFSCVYAEEHEAIQKLIEEQSNG